MKIKILLFLLIAIATNIICQKNLNQPLSERNANYNIEVTLDPIAKTLEGSETLVWRNITQTPTDELQFHLYLNAFKNTESTFMIESGMRHRGFSVDKSDSLSWGWIDINSFVINDKLEMVDSIKFIHPDKDHKKDQTVISIKLNQEIKPGQSISISIGFKAKLPQIMARTGFSDNYYLVGQWFPKIGVFEAAGQRGRTEAGWNCHQFHANSEFYADYGNYNVDINIPSEFVVGATGLLQNETINEDGTKNLNFYAEDVLDFAWTASPLFEVVKDKWKEVEITLLLQPQHLSQADRHIQSAKNAFEYFEENLGKYPYPSMTIVDPPFRGLASAGMEYPMFITAGCLWGMPDGLKLTETVTIHELGHNFFMGILASNEFEEAWLDEGFNTYFENRIMDHYYGEKHSVVDLFGFHMGDRESSRQNFTRLKNPYVVILDRHSWNYPNGGYGTASYHKPGVVLATLENLVGLENMNDIMRTYYEKWKFKHPTAQDFYDVVNEKVASLNDSALGSNMDWYFEQTVNTGDICDYKVQSFWEFKSNNVWGIFDSDSGRVLITDQDHEKEFKLRNKFLITREGELIFPQEILVCFEDGEEILEKYDGKARTKAFEYKRDVGIKWVHIDPNRKILFDRNLSNNSLNNKNETSVVWKYAAKILFWAQNTMVTLFL